MRGGDERSRSGADEGVETAADGGMRQIKDDQLQVGRFRNRSQLVRIQANR